MPAVEQKKWIDLSDGVRLQLAVKAEHYPFSRAQLRAMKVTFSLCVPPVPVGPCFCRFSTVVRDWHGCGTVAATAVPALALACVADATLQLLRRRKERSAA